MTSPLDNTNRTPYRKNRLLVTGGVFIVCIAVIILFSARAIGHSRLRGETVVVPLWRLDTRIVFIVKDIRFYIASRAKLERDTQGLREQVEALKSTEVELAVLKDENQKLKSLLSRNETTGRILATILIKPNRTPYDTIIVDAGSAEGIVAGQRVFARGNTLIGTVSDASVHTAHITLFSTPGQKTDGVIVGNDITITLIGRGGGAFEIDVPREVILPVNSVVTNVATFSYPIAVVGTPISSERDAIKKILAKTPINIQELKWVEIAK